MSLYFVSKVGFVEFWLEILIFLDYLCEAPENLSYLLRILQTINA